MKTPVSLIVDDAAPYISVYYTHAGKERISDGRPLLKYYPNEFFFRFCDIAERYGLRGKFSVVPMPGNLGDINHGIEGVPDGILREWLDGVKTRLVPAFSVCPEMLTHNHAVDLKTGAALAPNEQEWASTKDRTELTPYIAKALSILCEAGFSPAGVTSPWMFGIEVEDEYAAAISDALYEVTGRDTGWFFMRSRKGPGAKPWVEIGTDARTLVAVPATLSDRFWPSIDSSREGEEYSTEIADRLISKDGKSGEIIDVLESGGWPVLLSHWQSLMSNGRLTGLRALEKIAGRIEEHLSDRVEWKSCEEIMNIVAADRAAFPKPDFGD